MTDALDSYFGFLRSPLGMSGSPLNPLLAHPLNSQLQAQEVASVAALQAQAWNPDYQRMTEKFRREAFYRSCSQHWLNVMLDVELGLT